MFSKSLYWLPKWNESCLDDSYFSFINTFNVVMELKVHHRNIQSFTEYICSTIPPPHQVIGYWICFWNIVLFGQSPCHHILVFNYLIMLVVSVEIQVLGALLDLFPKHCVFFYLEFWTMDKGQKPSNSECYTP
jgi:hypothetical protein